MKSLWMLCVLALGLTLGAACGPQEKFCPTTGADMGGKCPINGDDGGPRQFDSGSGANQGNLCDPGYHGVVQPDGSVACEPNS